MAVNVNKRRINYSKWVTRGIVIAVALYMVSTLYDQYREMKFLRAQEAAIAQKIEETQKEVDGLKGQLENSNTDEYIERIAREHLKMIREDEMIFIDVGKNPR